MANLISILRRKRPQSQDDMVMRERFWKPGPYDMPLSRRNKHAFIRSMGGW